MKVLFPETYPSEAFFQSWKEGLNRYPSSSLKRIKAQKLFDQLEGWMLKDKPYLNKKLSLTLMAKKLATNTCYLSHAVNEIGGKSIKQYINAYRIAAFLDYLRLEEFQNLTLMGVAKASGFHSFSTFSRAFRIEKGCSPTDYIKENLQKPKEE